MIFATFNDIVHLTTS
jgi:hypothetical protein